MRGHPVLMPKSSFSAALIRLPNTSRMQKWKGLRVHHITKFIEFGQYDYKNVIIRKYISLFSLTSIYVISYRKIHDALHHVYIPDCLTWVPEIYSPFPFFKMITPGYI